jgi:VWFA-related protein
VALAVAMQASSFSQPALAKLKKVGAMIPEAVVGEGGEAAIIAFDDHLRLLQDFTTDPNAIADAFATFKPGSSSGGRMIDAAAKALDMLSHRPGSRRLNLLIISESRDRGSESKLTDLLAKAQHSGVTIYGLTYSAYWTAFTTKPEDYSPPEIEDSPGVLYTMPLTAILAEMGRTAKKNTVAALAATTGGRQFTFETKAKLENDLLALGNDIHSRYLLSFTPTETSHPEFHKLEVTIRSHPDARVRVRPGYWTGMTQGR